MALSINHRKSLASRAGSRQRRQLRGRKRIHGTAERPRLVVTRSAKHIRAQLVNDDLGHTLASASTLDAEVREADGDKTAKSRQVGALLAQRAKDADVEAVVFDRAGNRYAGRIAALAEGAREGGLNF